MRNQAHYVGERKERMTVRQAIDFVLVAISLIILFVLVFVVVPATA